MENRSLLVRAIARPEFGPFVLLALELLGFWAINHDFLSEQNISNTLAFTVELGLIALAMTLLMTSGEFDLSVGSLFGFSPVLMWTLFNGGHVPLAAMAASGIPPGFNIITGALYEKDMAPLYDKILSGK